MKAIKQYPNYFVTEEGLIFSSKTNKFLNAKRRIKLQKMS
jgi:hypothetical protein